MRRTTGRRVHDERDRLPIADLVGRRTGGEGANPRDECADSEAQGEALAQPRRPERAKDGKGETGHVRRLPENGRSAGGGGRR